MTSSSHIVAGASVRLHDYLLASGARRHVEFQSESRLRAGLAVCELDDNEWSGLITLEGIWGGLFFAPYPDRPAKRLGAAAPLLIGEPLREEGRGYSELSVEQSPPWPRMRCLGHELWLCGTTESLDRDFAADRHGRIYLWDRECDELTRVAENGLTALEKQALRTDARERLGAMPALTVGAVIADAILEERGLRGVPEASDDVSAYFTSEAHAVLRQSPLDPNVPQTQIRSRTADDLLGLAKLIRLQHPDAEIVCQTTGRRHDAVARRIGKLDIGIQVWR